MGAIHESVTEFVLAGATVTVKAASDVDALPSLTVMAMFANVPAPAGVEVVPTPTAADLEREALAELVDERRTVVLYEAPHRLARTLEDLRATLGGSRRVSLCRELTKLHDAWLAEMAKPVKAGEKRYNMAAPAEKKPKKTTKEEKKKARDMERAKKRQPTTPETPEAPKP